MDELRIDDLTATELPFFARFLEGQMEDLSETDATQIVGGRHKTRRICCGFPVVTQKYPSDSEDTTGGDVPMTKKYPSDNEDNSGGGVVTTQKFPSDGEDNTGNPIAMTLKYPSDGEDSSTPIVG